MSCKKLTIGLAFFVFVCAPQAWADEGDVVNLNASLSSLHDSNLFRLAPSVSPASVGLAGRSDNITATTLGLSEAAAKMTVTRMRRRYRELLRAEVAHTVAEPAEMEAELRHLFAVLQ